MERRNFMSIPFLYLLKGKPKMTVTQLIAYLEQCNPNAEVVTSLDGYMYRKVSAVVPELMGYQQEAKNYVRKHNDMGSESYVGLI